MAECFLNRQIIVEGGSDTTSFDYTNITHYFDLNSLDLENNQWLNTLGTDYFSLKDGFIEDNALKIIPGGYGEISCPLPNTIYIIVKKFSTTGDECIIGKGCTRSSSSYGFGLFLDSKTGYHLSITSSPYVETERDDNYHVFALSGFLNLNTNGTKAIMMFKDGILQGFLTGFQTGNYAGFITLNRVYYGGYSYPGIQDTYIKMVALGSEQTIEQIVSNSKYLYNKYIGG